MNLLASPLAQTNVTVEETFLFSYLFTFIGFALALLLAIKVISERRRGGNTLAWVLAILLLPYVGVPLYLIFGGRKNKRSIENKRAVQRLAREAAGVYDDRDNAIESPAPHIRYMGNRFEIIANGAEAYKRLCQEIDSATKSIHITTYIFTDDEVGYDIGERLAKRAKDGVEVRCLIDSLGSFGKAGRIPSVLASSGAQLVRFMPILPFRRRSSANLRNHRKLAIFDHERAWIGGQNLDKRFLRNKEAYDLFHDIGGVIEGPALSALNRLFVSDWCYAAHQSPNLFKEALASKPAACGHAEIEIIPSGPDVSRDTLWERIILMIQEARERITIVTPYFLPDEVVFQSLVVKAMGGYDVRIIVPLESNQVLVDFARSYYLSKLHNAGAKILFYCKGMIHAKLVLADEHIALTGSANIDMRSLFLNFEIATIYHSAGEIKAFHEWVDSILPYCQPYEKIKAPRMTPKRRIMEECAHLLAPLL